MLPLPSQARFGRENKIITPATIALMPQRAWPDGYSPSLLPARAYRAQTYCFEAPRG